MCSVLLFFVSYFVSRYGFPLDENSSVGLTESRQSNWVPFRASARHKEKKIRVAASYCTARVLNDDARRYRGNFVTDNSHGDIIGPGPINGELSSCSVSPRISSRPLPVHTYIDRELLVFCFVPIQLGESTRFCADKIKVLSSIFTKFQLLV